MTYRATSYALAIFTTGLLASCGGGDSNCHNEPYLINVSYPPVEFSKSVSRTYSPTKVDVPASCKSSVSFAIKNWKFQEYVSWPSTLSVDQSTGRISGTLTYQPGQCSLTKDGLLTSVYENSTTPACAQGGTLTPKWLGVELSVPGYVPFVDGVQVTFSSQ